MVEISKKTIAGLIITLIVSSGGTYYLQETGSYKNCKGGWIQIDNGKYECPTSSVEPQWCHHGSEEGPENIGYRCYLGIPMKSENIEDDIQISDFTLDTDGVHCYQKGNLLKIGVVENGNCIR